MAVLAVEGVGVGGALQALALRRGRIVLQPGLNRFILPVDILAVGHEVFDHGHMGKRRHLHIAIAIGNCLGAGQRIRAIDIHGAGAADPFTATPAEGERGIDLVLDIDDGIEHHRPAFGQVNREFIKAGVAPAFWVPAVDFKSSGTRRALGRVDLFAGFYL